MFVGFLYTIYMYQRLIKSAQDNRIFHKKNFYHRKLRYIDVYTLSLQ